MDMDLQGFPFVFCNVSEHPDAGTWSRCMQVSPIKLKAFPLPDFIAESYAVICDFDGTVTPFDVTDAILERFASPVWKKIEEEWVQGTISARECMERQVPLIEAKQDLLDSFLDTIPVTDGFADFVHYCRDEDIALTIVSDGMDYAITHILEKNGIRHVPVVANHLVRLREGYRLEFPYGRKNCPSGVCKCYAASIVGEGRKTLLIGDGLSDCCLAGTASFTLARHGKSLQRYCAEHEYPCQAYLDFIDILDAFSAPETDPYLIMPDAFPAADIL